MKTRTSMQSALAIVATSLGLVTGLNAQEAEGKLKVGDAEGKAKIDLQERDRDRDRNTTQIDRDRDTQYRAGERKAGVTKVNKASGLKGMQDKNHLGENLGEIQDLVIDLPSGRISYAVLSVGGFLGIGEKYIAVPPSVFSVSPEADKLVLNADKAKIQAAPGFVKTQWPDLNNPNWGGFAYWQTDGTDTDRSRTDLDRNRLDPNRTDRDRFDRDRTDRTDRFDRDRTLGTRDKPATSGQSFKGKITAINPEARTMTVSGESGTMNFTFTEKPNITLKDNRNPKLSDLKVGYPVLVGFHDEGGNHMAHLVVRVDTPEVK